MAKKKTTKKNLLIQSTKQGNPSVSPIVFCDAEGKPLYTREQLLARITEINKFLDSLK